MPPPPLRVLHVINGEHYSGAERVQDLLALRLPDFGFQVELAALKAGRFGEVRCSTAPLHAIDMASKWDLRASGEVARLVTDGGHDLLHAHTPRSAMVASLAALRTGVPLVYHVHSPTSRDSTRRLANFVNHHIERWSLTRARRLITVSPTLDEHMRSVGYSGDKITCVLNGVPEAPGATPRTRPNERPGAKFNDGTSEGPRDAWTIGMVALFRPRKGAEVLIEALAALSSSGLNVRLRAIGPFETDAYRRELLALAERLNVTDAIDWVGFTSDVGAELRRVDALALPSLFGEGLPMVVLEAMAAGLPVVATRCEGVAQAVTHRETGLLVEAGSVSQLGHAIEELVRGDVDYTALSQRSIERHREGFSDFVMAGRVADVYREVLGLPPIDHPPAGSETEDQDPPNGGGNTDGTPASRQELVEA